MFTTCPSCALNLAVTAADLRVGQGYVRCGRCVSVFNALISLADEAEVGPDEAHVEDRAAATQSRPVPAGLEDAANLDLGATDEAVPAVAEAIAQAVPDEAEAHEEHGPGDLAEVTDDSRDQATGTFETIILEGDTILQTEEFVGEAEVDEQIKALAEQIEEQDRNSERADEDEQEETKFALEAATPRPAPGFVNEPRAQYAADSLDELITPKRRRRPVPPLMIVAIVLGALLVLQMAHHWRYPLAAHLPWIGTVYAGMGAPLAPQWQLSAYDVRQLGAAADPANAQRIEVRASVRNGAERAQPAPVLRVVLQDRFGNEIGRHERAPADYLRGAALDTLAADQRVDASFWVDDPEQKAVGFELDACLRGSEGALRCASDAKPPPR